MTRKEEREQAFCLVFEKCFNNDNAQDILDLAREVRDFKITDYIESTFIGVIDNLDTIDGVIAPCLKNWSIERLPKTSLALLRLAVYEMKYNDSVPESVTINEIVELAKTYSDEKDAAYINGVLGTVSRNGENA